MIWSQIVFITQHTFIHHLLYSIEVKITGSRVNGLVKYLLCEHWEVSEQFCVLVNSSDNRNFNCKYVSRVVVGRIKLIEINHRNWHMATVYGIDKC